MLNQELQDTVRWLNLIYGECTFEKRQIYIPEGSSVAKFTFKFKYGFLRPFIRPHSPLISSSTHTSY